MNLPQGLLCPLADTNKSTVLQATGIVVVGYEVRYLLGSLLARFPVALVPVGQADRHVLGQFRQLGDEVADGHDWSILPENGNVYWLARPLVTRHGWPLPRKMSTAWRMYRDTGTCCRCECSLTAASWSSLRYSVYNRIKWSLCCRGFPFCAP